MAHPLHIGGVDHLAASIISSNHQELLKYYHHQIYHFLSYFLVLASSLGGLGADLVHIYSLIQV
jgi:hypothetical protein